MAIERRHKWKPIQDLPSNAEDLGSTELAHLLTIWKEQKQKLNTSQALRDFHERLGREWAIETGIIEGLYTLDRGTTQLLIENGITASLIVHGSSDKPPELVASIIAAQKEALEGVFDFVASRRPLSKSYIKELHQLITRHQDKVIGVDQFGNYVETNLVRGDWKKLPNNPLRADSYIHEYCPPEHVESEMDQLIKWHLQHTETRVAPEVEAAWLHHRFTEIHPFQDGNGRIARALASLVLIREGGFPVTIHRDHRADYIAALETADKGDLADLVDVMAKIQKQAFLKALSVSETVLKEYLPVKNVIEAGILRLETRRREQREDLQQVFQLADVLKREAVTQLKPISRELGDALQKVNYQYRSSVEASGNENDTWFKKQIVDVARSLGYYADTATHRSWVRLKIRDERQTEFVVSFHSLGTEFVGVLVATAFVDFRERDENGVVTVEGPYAVCEAPFELSYFDSDEKTTERFRVWLNRCTLLGIDHWRRQL